MMKLFSKKAGISYLEILILVVSMFAIPYLIYQSFGESEIVIEKIERPSLILKVAGLLLKQLAKPVLPLVSAEEFDSVARWCCPENNAGVLCDNLPVNECSDSCSVDCIPTGCNEVSSCEVGCCYDSDEGLCTTSNVKEDCLALGGDWRRGANCETPVCREACCVVGSETRLTTEKECRVWSDRSGISAFDWKSNVNTEMECSALSNSLVKGACVYDIENNFGEIDRSCRFITKQECLQRTSAGNFYGGLLCTNPELDSVCRRTQETTCVEGKDEVYFLDSCGNVANVYDSTKVSNDLYWSRVFSETENCVLENDGSSKCGNCNRFAGSICNPYRSGQDEEPKYGENVCRNLDCPVAPANVGAQDRKNGESWCVYDGYIGDGKDTVGSRHLKYYCQEGEVKVEPCMDFRQEICVETVSEESDRSFAYATCRTNRWRECIGYNNLVERIGENFDFTEMGEMCEENPDCYIKGFNFGEGYEFSQCVPMYPGGFSLNSERAQETAKGICSMADFECTRLEIDGDCEFGCECGSVSYTQQMNEWCVSLGDCGGYVNFVGGKDDAYGGNVPRIDLNQYVKYTQPVEGQRAVPLNKEEFREFIGQMTGVSDYDNVSINEALLEWGGGITGGAGILGGVLATENVGVLSPSLFGAETGLGASFMILVYAGIGAVVGWGMAKMFGWGGKQAVAAIIGGTIGGIGGAIGLIALAAEFTKLGAILGSWAGPVGALVGGIIGAAIGAAIGALFGWGDEDEAIFYFSCKPWQANVGGSDCGKCNEGGKPCSKYRCESLGQTCQFVNEGTGQELCVEAQRDEDAPFINSWKEILTEGFDYMNDGNLGFKLREEGGDCVPALTPIEFGIQTNKISQCKWDYGAGKEYSNMESYFGDNLFKQNHSLPLALPSLEMLQQAGTQNNGLISETGELRVYAKCQNVNGIVSPEYLIDICVKSGPDKTPPIMFGALPESGDFIKYGATEQNVTLFINEPSNCRWSYDDEAYGGMTHNFDCVTGTLNMGRFGWTCDTTLPITDNNQFYFRCRDNPDALTDEERNANRQSFSYGLEKSSGELIIDDISPEGEVIANANPSLVTIEVFTSAGAESGKAICKYKFSDTSDWVDELGSTDSNRHLQNFDYMYEGTHNIVIGCWDNAGNYVEGSTNFELKVDESSPRLIRMYHEGSSLKIMTNEDARCGYSFENCDFDVGDSNSTRMAGSGRSHTASWLVGSLYHIRCKDDYENEECVGRISAYE